MRWNQNKTDENKNGKYENSIHSLVKFLYNNVWNSLLWWDQSCNAYALQFTSSFLSIYLFEFKIEKLFLFCGFFDWKFKMTTIYLFIYLSIFYFILYFLLFFFFLSKSIVIFLLLYAQRIYCCCFSAIRNVSREWEWKRKLKKR